MSYGSLTVIVGPMYAGKTSTMIFEATKRDAVVFKPTFDTRFSDSECVSHDGEFIAAHPISSMADIAAVGELEKPYCFDEVQFFDEDRYEGDFVGDIKKLLGHGVDIITCGLDMDWRGDPFIVTAKLTAMADEVIKLGSSCIVCGSIASKTRKKSGSNTIELGAADMYEPRCNRHWYL